MASHWSLMEQVSSSLLSIRADLNNAVVWMVSTCPLIFKSSSPYNNPLQTVSTAPITIGITDTFMPHSFSISLQGLDTYSTLCFFSQFYPVVCRNGKIPKSAGCLFRCWLSLGLVVWPRLDDPFESQNPWEHIESRFQGLIWEYAKVTVQLMLWKVLPRGLVQYCSRHYCVAGVKLFLHTFS